MKIILGSKSSGRRLVMDELKKELGISYEIMSADIDEKTIRSHDPKELTLLIAKAKSEALRGKISEPIILITADTVIVQYGILMEKPISKDQARIWLRSFHNAPLEVISAMVVFNTQTRITAEAKFESKVYFRQIPANDVERMLEHEHILDWAGAFGIQDSLQESYITKIEGDRSNVLGLDKEILMDLLKDLGYDNN